jgi:hypothetical protein
LSQPPYRPAPSQPAGATPPPRAAPTQIAYPGQVQLPPQPQYAAQRHQATPQLFATGFPNYVSPPPSPRRLTGYVVGTAVVVVTVLFAVVGFLLVS